MFVSENEIFATMKTFFALLLILIFSLNLQAQIGIGNTSPEAALDIQSSSQGLLIPRVSLTSNKDTSTIVNPRGGAIEVSTLVYNTGTGGLSTPGFYYWDGALWQQFLDSSPKVYMGKALITASGAL